MLFTQKELKGEMIVNFGEWKDDKHTKKGINLILLQLSNRVGYLEYLDQAETDKKNYNSLIGGNIYCMVTEGTAFMGIRNIGRWWFVVVVMMMVMVVVVVV